VTRPQPKAPFRSSSTESGVPSAVFAVDATNKRRSATLATIPQRLIQWTAIFGGPAGPLVLEPTPPSIRCKH